ncbi:putative transporter [Mycena kentingensis (nom. inval.)]|nr:putative transporter [Mycena kentingensis (nom. inval.)]
MQFKALLTLLVAAATSNAVVVDLFTNPDCTGLITSRNIFDNSCALLGGFSAYRITTSGPPGQQLTAYSRNACAGPVTVCTPVAVTGSCVRATNNDGASNAMSSSPVCGTV